MTIQLVISVPSSPLDRKVSIRADQRNEDGDWVHGQTIGELQSGQCAQVTIWDDRRLVIEEK